MERCPATAVLARRSRRSRSTVGPGEAKEVLNEDFPFWYTRRLHGSAATHHPAFRTCRNQNLSRGLRGYSSTERAMRASRNNFALVWIHCALDTNHDFRVVIVFLADIFKQFQIGSPPQEKTTLPYCRVRSGIIDRDFIFHGVHVDACEAFD